MPAESPKVQSIWRYPIKGLSPEPLGRTRLAVGATLPCDRLYAIENGPSGFDPKAPRHQPKQRYLMLMRNESLARLRSRFDEISHTLVIDLQGREAARGDLRTPSGRAQIERSSPASAPASCAGRRGCCMRPASASPTWRSKVVSIINLASLARSKERSAAPVHPLRFRGNVYVSGWPAWHEFELLGREVAIGPTARVRIVKRIVRCAATDVDPDTGIRDLSIPATLLRCFGHADCGVYGEVVAAGDIAVGDPLHH